MNNMYTDEQVICAFDSLMKSLSEENKENKLIALRSLFTFTMEQLQSGFDKWKAKEIKIVANLSKTKNINPDDYLRMATKIFKVLTSHVCEV